MPVFKCLLSLLLKIFTEVAYILQHVANTRSYEKT